MHQVQRLRNSPVCWLYILQLLWPFITVHSTFNFLWSCVSDQERRAGTPVCYLRNRSSSRFQPIITQKLWHLFLPNLHILKSSYTVPCIPNLKEIAPAVPEIRVPETRQIFFVFFFFFTPNNKFVCKVCSYAPISTKFGAKAALPKPCISTKFGTICSKIKENMSDSR